MKMRIALAAFIALLLVVANVAQAQQARAVMFVVSLARGERALASVRPMEIKAFESGRFSARPLTGRISDYRGHTSDDELPDPLGLHRSKTPQLLTQFGYLSSMRVDENGVIQWDVKDAFRQYCDKNSSFAFEVIRHSYSQELKSYVTSHAPRLPVDDVVAESAPGQAWRRRMI